MWPFRKKYKKMPEDRVRVVKIGKEAIFEFLYEQILDGQDDLLETDGSTVSTSFTMDFERGEFILCAYRSENDKGEPLSLPEGIDLQKLMERVPDTAETLYETGRYREYTKEELLRLSSGESDPSAEGGEI